MAPRRNPAPVLLLAAIASGCPAAEPEPAPVISALLAGTASSSALMAATIAAELAICVADPPGPGGCPAGAQDGDSLTLSYGSGCVPDSGITGELISGQATLTVAGGSGVFIGDLETLGLPDLPLIGEVSGTTSRAGDLLAADVQFAGLSWTLNGRDVTLDALFEVSADPDGLVLDASSGSFVPGPDVVVDFDVDGVGAAWGTMGACFVPAEGTIALERDTYTATIAYSPETAESGRVTVLFGDREPESLAPCP